MEINEWNVTRGNSFLGNIDKRSAFTAGSVAWSVKLELNSHILVDVYIFIRRGSIQTQRNCQQTEQTKI